MKIFTKRILGYSVIFLFVLLSFPKYANSSEFTLLYAKAFPNPFYTTKGSKNIALVGWKNISLVNIENGNITFVQTILSKIHFVHINDSKNELYIVHSDKQGLKVDVYDINSWLLLKSKKPLVEGISFAELSSDKKYLLIVNNSYNTKIYDLESDTIVYDFQKEIDKDFITYFAKFSNDGKKIALLGGTKIYIFDLERKIIAKEINAINYHVHRVIFSNNDKNLLRFNYGSTEVFNIESGAKIQTFDPGGKTVAVALTENDSLLFVQSASIVYIWDFNKGILVDTLHNVRDMALLKLDNTEYLVVGNRDAISIRDINTREHYRTISHNFFSSQFIGNGTYFVSGVLQKNFNIFQTSDCSLIKDLKNVPSRVFFPNSTLFCYYKDDTVYVQDVLNGSIYEKNYFPIPNYRANLGFSNDFQYLYYADTNQSINVYDWERKEKLYVIDSIVYFPFTALKYICLLPSINFHYIAGLKSTSDYNTRRLFVANARNGSILFEYPVPRDTGFGIAFSFDEKFFFFRVGNNPIHQLDLRNLKIVRTFNDLEIPTQSLSMHFLAFPDRPWLAFSSRGDPNIIILDYNTGKIVEKLFGNIKYETTPEETSLLIIDISPDGRYLMAEYSEWLIIWKVPQFNDICEEQKTYHNEKIFIEQTIDQLKINLHHDKPNKLQFFIYDHLGRVKISYFDNMQPNGFCTTSFDLSNFNTGVYFLVAQIGNEWKTLKFNIIK